jgi:hypothetical protein
LPKSALAPTSQASHQSNLVRAGLADRPTKKPIDPRQNPPPPPPEKPTHPKPAKLIDPHPKAIKNYQYFSLTSPIVKKLGISQYIYPEIAADMPS